MALFRLALISAALLTAAPAASLAQAPTQPRTLTIDGPALRGGLAPSSAGDTFSCTLQAGHQYAARVVPVRDGYDYIYFTLELQGPGDATGVTYIPDVYNLNNSGVHLLAAATGVHTLRVHSPYSDAADDTYFLPPYMISLFDEGPTTDTVPNYPNNAAAIPLDGTPVTGSMDSANEYDVWHTALQPGVLYQVDVHLTTPGSTLWCGFTTRDSFPGAYVAESLGGANPMDARFIVDVREPYWLSNQYFQATGSRGAAFTVSIRPIAPDGSVIVPGGSPSPIPLREDAPTPILLGGWHTNDTHLMIAHLRSGRAYQIASGDAFGQAYTSFVVTSQDGRSTLALASLDSTFALPTDGDFLIRVMMPNGGASFILRDLGAGELAPRSTPATAALLSLDGAPLLFDSASLRRRSFCRSILPPHSVSVLEWSQSDACSATAYVNTFFGDEPWLYSPYGSPRRLEGLLPDGRTALGIVVHNPSDRPRELITTVQRDDQTWWCPSNSPLQVRLTPLASSVISTSGYARTDPSPMPANGAPIWIARDPSHTTAEHWGRLTVQAGHRYLLHVAAQTSTYTRLALRAEAESGALLTEDNDIIAFTAHESGPIWVRITDLSSPTIMLTDTAFALIIDELPTGVDDHGDAATSATPLLVPGTLDGITETIGDIDAFTVHLIGGSTYNITTTSTGRSPATRLVAPPTVPYPQAWTYPLAARIVLPDWTPRIRLRVPITGDYTVLINRYRDWDLPVALDTTPTPYHLEVRLISTIADIAGPGGTPGPDGQLTADDLIVFINAFLADELATADIASFNGLSLPDGYLTVDDIVAFLSAFFAG